MTRFLLAAFSLLAFASCDDELLSVEKTFDGASVTLVTDTESEAGAIVFAPVTITPDFDARLESLGVKPGLVESVKLDQVTITVIDPTETITLADISAATIIFAAPDGTTEIVAVYAGTSTPVTTDQFSVRDTEIKAFLERAEFTSNVSLVTSKVVPAGVSFKFDIKYLVKAGV